MAADPLSDALTLFNTRSFLSGGVVAGGAWAIRFPPPGAVKFAAVVRGACWLTIEGGGAPVWLETGDVIVTNGRRALSLASDPDLSPVEAESVFADASGGVAQVGQGDEFYMLGGHVAFDPAGASLLFDLLPPVIHVRRDSPQATVLHWLLERLTDEMASARPGSGMIAGQLAQLLFVHVLRDYVDTGAAAGWLKAIGDRRLAAAMGLMHAQPARDWRLVDLAKAAGMSRSSFAERFKAEAGMAPRAYLTFWRMRLAERALRDGAPSLAALASSLGYASESAFSSAFKRAIGLSPAHYRTRARIEVQSRS
jgi:AraC-like DNA-binding protein